MSTMIQLCKPSSFDILFIAVSAICLLLSFILKKKYAKLVVSMLPWQLGINLSVYVMKETIPIIVICGAVLTVVFARFIYILWEEFLSRIMKEFKNSKDDWFMDDE